MAVTTIICTGYKSDCQNGVHEVADVYKVALFVTAAALSAATAAYAATNEVAAGGGYTTAGFVLAGRSVSTQGTKGCLDFTDLTVDPTTLTARYALIYNSTSAGKEAIAVLDFGADVSTTNGPLTLDFPVPGALTSLLRIA